MRDQIIKNITVKSDEDGNFTVRCPECNNQFKTAASNISDSPDSPIITCPACGRELDHVHLAGEEVDAAIEQVKSEAMEEAKKELEDSIKKLFR